jgi:hypothetical protein
MRRGLVTIALAFAGLAAGAARQVPHPPETSLRAVVDAGAAYVNGYEQGLTSVLADETYTQQIRAQMPADPSMPRTRRLTSETFFMFASGSREWMAIRDVIAVDGQPVEDRPDIRAQLREIPVSQVGATLKNHNARFNLGRLFRNFNEPTLSLLPLDANHRDNFTFERKSVDIDGDATLVKIAFSEKSSGPTLIRDLNLHHVPSKGELLIEAGTGRVRRASLDVRIGAIHAQMWTTYARDEKLGMWVPVAFNEHYERGREPSGAAKLNADYEDVLCEAKYTNFRRFDVTVRIK